MSAYYERIRRVRRKYLRHFDGECRVLDVGCGEGTLMKFLLEEGFSVVGVDRDMVAVGRAVERQLSVEEKDFMVFLRENERSFGGIICSHVIEHIPVGQCEAFIGLCYRALTANGIMVIITPNVHTLSGSADFWNDPSHVRPHTLGSVEKLLSDAGFEVVERGFDRETAFTLRKDVLHLPLDLMRLLYGFICYGKATRFSEIFAVGRKVSGQG